MFGRSPSYNLDYIGCHVSLLSRSLQPHRIDFGVIYNFPLAINKSILHRPFYQGWPSISVEQVQMYCQAAFSKLWCFQLCSDLSDESIYALISPPPPFRTHGE